MLILTRAVDEDIVIRTTPPVVVRLCEIRTWNGGNPKARIGIIAPAEINVVRRELLDEQDLGNAVEDTLRLCTVLEGLKQEYAAANPGGYALDPRTAVIEAELRRRLPPLDRAAAKRDRVHRALAYPIGKGA